MKPPKAIEAPVLCRPTCTVRQCSWVRSALERNPYRLRAVVPRTGASAKCTASTSALTACSPPHRSPGASQEARPSGAPAGRGVRVGELARCTYGGGRAARLPRRVGQQRAAAARYARAREETDPSSAERPDPRPREPFTISSAPRARRHVLDAAPASRTRRAGRAPPAAPAPRVAGSASPTRGGRGAARCNLGRRPESAPAGAVGHVDALNRNL